MSNMMLPGPRWEEPEKAGCRETPHDQPQADAGLGRECRHPHVPDRQACLLRLAQLPGLVALRMLTPSQANVMRGVYRDILQEHRSSQTAGGQQALPDATVLELARTSPEVVNLLAPLLTDEQVAALMRASKDGCDGQD